ncbi:MAG: ChaN family lipoprotein [Flavobacteriales bacterium]|nr:ChaN family lipoprotein [Flavobacteriales bacterium]
MKFTPLLFSLILIICYHSASGQKDMPAYRIYDAKGKQMDFKEVLNRSVDQDVVLFGELHNNPIDHWLQLELMRALSEEGDVSVGAEMFEMDDQIVLNEYLADRIKLDHLKKEAKLWPNYDTDYAPLVELAKAQGIPFIATNVPRRYASLVSREGQSALIELEGASAILPSLPFEVTAGDRGYEEMKEMMGGHSHGMNMDLLVEAQALKDHCMASNILTNLNEEGVFLHFNGSFHSQYKAGIVGYLLAAKPALKILVIAAVEADSLDFQEEWSELGDIILITPTSLTKTH